MFARFRMPSLRRGAVTVAPLVLTGALAVGLAGPVEAATVSSSAAVVTAKSSPILGYGSKGEAVRTLQRLLGIRVDGDFRSDTRRAVVGFQKRKGLLVDGVVGPETWRALGKAPARRTPSVNVSGKFANGQLPGRVLCPIPWATHEQLRCDAMPAFKKLNGAYKARFGRNTTINDAYRSYAEQVRMKRLRGRFAARPGRSQHGWGVAVDLGGGVNRFGTVQHNWMRSNAGRFGFMHPVWARKNGRLPEPWHWEYRR